MATTAELLTAGLSYYSSAGSPSIAADLRERQRAHFWLTKVCNRVDNAAPNWWRLGDGSVALTAGVGTMPADFAHAGEKMRVFVSGQTLRELVYKPPEHVKGLIQGTPQNGVPDFYTLSGRTAVGLPKILCWPTDASTLVLLTYTKRMPELIDAPLAPVPTVTATVGLPNGGYTYKVTNVTAAGETEGGDVSSSVTAVLFKVQLTAIRTWWGRTVTSRKLYRPVVSGLQHKLVTTLSDNLTTTYLDNIADGALGADIPLPAAAITGMEYFPEAFHDSAIFDGLVYFLARQQGDGRDVKFDAKWEQSVRRLWEEYRQGQNTVEAFPPYPGEQVAGGGVWSRWSRPS